MPQPGGTLAPTQQGKHVQSAIRFVPAVPLASSRHWGSQVICCVYCPRAALILEGRGCRWAKWGRFVIFSHALHMGTLLSSPSFC